MVATHSAEAALETLHVLDGRRLGAFQQRLVWICVLALAGETAEVVLVVLFSACAQSKGGGIRVTAVLGASACVGQLLGAAFVASSADIFGRRKLFVACDAIVAVGGLMSAAAPASIAMLAFLRGVVGLGVGGGAALSAVLMVEYLPVLGRGQLLLQAKALSATGGLYVTICAWLVLGSQGWRALAVLAAMPAVASAIIARNLMPESPRWLQRQGRADEAAAVVARVAADNGVELPPGAMRLCTPARQWQELKPTGVFPYWRRQACDAGRHFNLVEEGSTGEERIGLTADDDEASDVDDVASLADSRDESEDEDTAESEDLRVCCCYCGSLDSMPTTLRRSETEQAFFLENSFNRDDSSCNDDPDESTSDEGCFFGHNELNKLNLAASDAVSAHNNGQTLASNKGDAVASYGAATALSALAALRSMKLRSPTHIKGRVWCGACRALALIRSECQNDGIAVGRAMRHPNGSQRNPRVAVCIGTLGRRTAPLWLHSFMLGAVYLATATLSSLFFARAVKGPKPDETDDCATAFDYRGLAVGSLSEAASAALAALVVDGGRKRLLSSLLAAAAAELLLLCFPLTALATALVSLVARAALFAASAVAWTSSSSVFCVPSVVQFNIQKIARRFAAELYPTEIRATAASHAAACSRLGGACSSLLVVSRFSYAALRAVGQDVAGDRSDSHFGRFDPLLSKLLGPLSIIALVAALVVWLIPLETAQKPAVEAPLIAPRPRRPRRSRLDSSSGQPPRQRPPPDTHSGLRKGGNSSDFDDDDEDTFTI